MSAALKSDYNYDLWRPAKPSAPQIFVLLNRRHYNCRSVSQICFRDSSSTLIDSTCLIGRATYLIGSFLTYSPTPWLFRNYWNFVIQKWRSMNTKPKIGNCRAAAQKHKYGIEFNGPLKCYNYALSICHQDELKRETESWIWTTFIFHQLCLNLWEKWLCTEGCIGGRKCVVVHIISWK